jgi:hypothetical protein
MLLVYQRFAPSPHHSRETSPGPGAYVHNVSLVKSGSSAMKFAKKDRIEHDEPVPGPTSYFEDGKYGIESTASFTFV